MLSSKVVMRDAAISFLWWMSALVYTLVFIPSVELVSFFSAPDNKMIILTC